MNSNPDASLQASFWVMIALQTLGAVDMPGQGNRKLPAPRQYVPVIIAWSGLQIFADVGQTRGAEIAGWVMVLAGSVLGPFGNKAASFLKSVATQFQSPLATTSGASTTPTTGTISA